MSGTEQNKDESPQGFKQYAELQLQQNNHLNGKMNELTTQMGTLATNMGEFMGVMAKSEERHVSHSEQINRLDDNQKKQGSNFYNYKEKNDERVNVVEKQVLLLDKDVGLNAKPWNSIKAIGATAAGAVLTAIIIYMLLP